ncbi:UPF0481 protein At3g47200-like [Vigna unguiculata]|uniref:Uncharacterized protein n=1 Tax=Vigna unguiculata TaxID=3917 RepID=A0A4D6NS90_VIGUN|nr:UPF0481 protein At3g47200-like [Vigna unguiculata]QCE16228.1 hypothetical protein DEO72_LG11g3241 [Vigna unguiculata]
MMNKDDVVIHVKGMLERANTPVTKKCSIYKVPLLIRQLNQKAYTPKVVSIGPYHHSSHRLRNMERHKVMYCKSFLERVKTKTSMESWIKYIADKEDQIRKCYSDAIPFSSNKLVEIICVDSGFILELFWITHHYRTSETYLSTPWFENAIFSDLLLLENQLPFFVLNDLFSLSIDDSDTTSFIQLTFEYFQYFNKSKLSHNHITCHHFTDLLRTFYLCGREKTTRADQWPHIPSVTKLSEAGIRFASFESKCLLNLSFSNRVLQIPKFKMADNTEQWFRNMIALEQFHYPKESYITEYALVLQYLVNTGKDVDILVKEGVMENLLGDSDVAAEKTKRLCRNIVLSDFSSDYVSLWQNLDASYKSRKLKLKSTLRRDYCKGPWQTAATISAIVLLILSFIQTVCSVWQIT